MGCWKYLYQGWFEQMWEQLCGNFATISLIKSHDRCTDTSCLRLCSATRNLSCLKKKSEKKTKTLRQLDFNGPFIFSNRLARSRCHLGFFWGEREIWGEDKTTPFPSFPWRLGEHYKGRKCSCRQFPVAEQNFLPNVIIVAAFVFWKKNVTHIHLYGRSGF